MSSLDYLLRKLRYCSCRASAVIRMMLWKTSRSRAHVFTLLAAAIITKQQVREIQEASSFLAEWHPFKLQWYSNQETTAASNRANRKWSHFIEKVTVTLRINHWNIMTFNLTSLEKNHVLPHIYVFLGVRLKDIIRASIWHPATWTNKQNYWQTNKIKASRQTMLF